MAAGSSSIVEKIGKNLSRMEKEKKYTFNNGNGKSHWMIIKTGREKEEEIEIIVEKGKIDRTKEYKYLGNWLTEKGNIERQLDEIRSKTKGMIAEVKRIGSEGKTGRMSTEVQLLMYERTVLPAMIYNLEVWTNWRKSDWEQLERIQNDALKEILQLPKGTAGWGLRKELGLWPLKERIVYKKLMMYQQMMNATTERLCTKVVKEQKRMKYEKCWYSELEEDAKTYGVDLEQVEEKKKSEWKKMVKERINGEVERKTKESEIAGKKQRHQKGNKFERQEYLKEVGIRKASEMIRTRLEMWDIGRNMGKDWKCKCGEDETIEHIMTCQRMKERYGSEMEIMDVENAKKEELGKVTEWVIRYIEERQR